ncbi:MAG: YceI family protein [Ginsengibacter sp.]
MKKIFLACVILVAMSPAYAQKYFTKNGHISFFSKTILENISANNEQVISVLDIQTGEIQFSLLNNAFHFPKAKMEDDFNEDYMESSKYQKSTFKGKVLNITNINFGKDGVWEVSVTGNLMIHGVTKNITARGQITIKDEKIATVASFRILLKDYNIKVPSIVSNKISESIDVTVDCLYQKK